MTPSIQLALRGGRLIRFQFSTRTAVATFYGELCLLIFDIYGDQWKYTLCEARMMQQINVFQSKKNISGFNTVKEYEIATF